MATEPTEVLPARIPPGRGATAERRALGSRAQYDLSQPEVYAEWLAAYRQCLREGVVPVVLDYAHRLLGKPREVVELHSDAESPVASLTREELLALARATLPERP